MKKKHFWILGIAAVLLFIAIPAFHLLKTKLDENQVEVTTPSGHANDASGLSLTQVDTIIKVPSDKHAIQEQLKQVLAYARKNDLKVSIAGAQHSMGGHTIYPNGVLINMLPYNHMEFDSLENMLTIGSGALWKDALKYLDGFGKSVAVMQAFSSFSVGGSVSVNGHGWQKNLPPVSSSVVSFTLMNHEGEILNCSPTENSELFGLALGGYGLFGIILDVKLRVVENRALVYRYKKLSTENYLEKYEALVSENENAELVFGRLRISDKRFLEDATLNYFEKTTVTPPPLDAEGSDEAKRLVFRGSVNSEYGKRLRWDLETGVSSLSKNSILSRNNLLNDDVSLIENKDTGSTDILHEYFVPKRTFYQFIDDMKPILSQSDIDLLNITIRRVENDTITFMNYAREPVYGFVFLFNQKKTVEGENSMKQLTQLLVDAVIRNEGTFYLPYRLHIGKEQMRKVYPQADRFFEQKRVYDPTEIFSNKFYGHYK